MPQPIDLNTELSRATAAQRIQELTDRALLAAQVRQSQHALEEQVAAETQVQQPPQSEHESQIGDHEQRKQQNKGKNKHGEASASESTTSTINAGDLAVLGEDEVHRLDVSI